MATETNTREPDPSYTLPVYDKALPMWELIEDCIEGEFAIKAKEETYLPRPNPTDLSNENKARYAAYLLRAVFYNFTARTRNGLVGQVFQKDPQLEIPVSLNAMQSDVDGSGVTLEQQTQRALGEVVAKGRSGLFVDFPVIEGEVVTVKDLKDGKIHPVIIRISPERIINWRTTQVGSKTVLSLVVIQEDFVVEDTGFEECIIRQWRELRLVDGVYSVRIWQEKEESGKKEIIKEFMPAGSKGETLNFIPFIFIGSINNDPEIDQPPLFDMAILNVAHYRNSADYEEASYILGQPTPFFSGLTKTWVEDIMKGEIQLGARAAVMLPEGGEAGLLQVAPNTLPKEAMDQKEKQAVSIGARLVETKQVQRTATESAADTASESSILGNAANNVSSAYVIALSYAGMFLGDNTVSVVQLNTDFERLKMTPEERKALMLEWQQAAITDKEMRDKLIDSGVAFEDFEMWLIAKEQQELTKSMFGMPEDDGNEDT